MRGKNCNRIVFESIYRSRSPVGVGSQKDRALGLHDFRRPFVARSKGATPVRDVPPEIARGTTAAPDPSRSCRRPSAPSVRFRRAQMGRSAFLRIVGCWIGGLLALLVLALVIRIAA
jgi:hypothetical protein